MKEAARKAPPATEVVHGTARWLNMVTTLVLGAAALIVGAAATPSLLRAGVSAQSAPDEFAPPIRSQGPQIVPGGHPLGHDSDPPPRGAARGYDDDDDEPEVPLPEGPAPRLSPNDPRAKPPRSAGGDSDPLSGLNDALGLKGGVAARAFSLRDRRTSSVLEEVRPGDKIHILREDGDWVLVVKTGKGANGELVTGWARRSELLLR